MQNSKTITAIFTSPRCIITFVTDDTPVKIISMSYEKAIELGVIDFTKIPDDLKS